MANRLAAVPVGSMVDPCCCNCWGTFGDNMEVTISGIDFCGCLSDTPGGGGTTRYWSPISFTGVNGVFTAIASSPGNPANTIWSIFIGTITLQEFDGSPTRPAAVCDGTPIGDPIDVDVGLTIDCFAEEGNGLQAFIGTTPPLVGTGGQIFTSTDFAPETWFQPADVVPNLVSCAVDGIGYFANVMAGGSLIITPP